jgi:hypothetical protein
MTTSHVAECPDLGPACFDGGPAPTPFNHHVDQLLAETNFDVSLGISENFAIDARWGFRVVDITPTYSELDGRPKQVPNDIHHREETLVGATDPWLVARLGHRQGDFVGTLRLGLTFPVGPTVPDPYALGREGKSHQHTQFGTGTVVPVVGIGVAYEIAPVTIGLSGTGLFNAYENDEGFRAPVRLFANHRVGVSILDGMLQPFADVSLVHEGEEFWQGEVGLEGSNIRTELYVGGGLAFRFYDPWTVEATFRARAARLTDAASFEVPGIFGLSFSTSFDLWTTDPSPP